MKDTFNSKIKEITIKSPVANQNLTSKTDSHKEHKLERNAPGIIKTDIQEEHPLRNVLKVDSHEEHTLERNATGIIKTDIQEKHPSGDFRNIETLAPRDSGETSHGLQFVRGIVDLKDRVTLLNLNKDDVPFIKEHTVDAALKDINALGTLWDTKPLPKTSNSSPPAIKQEAIKDNTPEITKSDPEHDELNALRAELDKLKRVRTEDLSDVDLSDMDDDYSDLRSSKSYINYPPIDSKAFMDRLDEMDKEINKEMNPPHQHTHNAHSVDEDHFNSTAKSGTDLEDLKQQIADLEAKLAAEAEEMAQDKAIFDSRLSAPSPISMESTDENKPAQASQINPSLRQAELDRLDADKQTQLYNPSLYNHGIINDPEKIKTILKDTELRGNENAAALFCYSEHGRPMMYVKNRDGDILEKPLTSITKNEIKYCFDNNIRLVKPEPKANAIHNESTAVKVKKSGLSRFLSIFTTRQSFSWKAFKIG